MNLACSIRLLRPAQWVKNLLLLFPPFFGGIIHSEHVVSRLPWLIVSFSLIASCGYIVNDIKDVAFDRNHQTKNRRPMPSGEVSVLQASLLAIVLFISAIILSFLVNSSFWIYLVMYLFLSVSYTFIFKNIIILDIFVISLGFLIRVLAGGYAFNIVVTNWLFLTVFMVSLLLATGKRLGEMLFLGDEAKYHRKSLDSYTQSFLESTLWFSSSAALVMYALYSLEHKNIMFYTVPIAVYGLLRYIYIVKEGKGDPTDALLKDKQVMAVGVLWVFVVGCIVYG